MTEKVLKVAWWSILLGVGMELMLLLAAAGMGAIPGLKPIIADLAQKVSWSLVVCAGLAAGTGASRARGAIMGMAGFFSAPVAFYGAKALHKSTLEALAIAAPMGGVPSPMVLAAIKAVEYAWLGMALAWLAKRATGPQPFALLGLATGLVFAGIIIALQVSQSPAQPAPAALVSRAVNEVLFPIGCSLVLFAAAGLGKAKA